MQPRPVPRNIDRPNRTPEYVTSYLVAYYGTMFLTHEPLIGLTVGLTAVYIIYKVTLDKPEGMMMRLAYRYVKIGKMIPSPRHAKIFEI